MSNKEIALDVINRLPADTSLHDMARKLEFVASVQEGFDQIERGEGISIRNVDKMIGEWTTK
jgi:hypothetical protein